MPKAGCPIDRILAIGAPISDALAAAHDKGIVHRDLKPANVMITTDGRVKVLDFGLAKELREADPMDVTLASSPHTEIGVVMGTPAYMSPEQVVGAALDHRTDIFSLGVLLYEIVTGQRPFQGRSSAETTSAILRDTPAAVTEVRADVPGDLARIIRRCLEKDPRHRIQTARDVANEIRDIGRQTGAMEPQESRQVIGAARPASRQSSGTPETDRGDVPWIAVLPVKAQGSDPELAAFADGLGEDITAGLSRFSHLFVISRHSALQYTERSLDVRAIGRELGARYALEGAVRKAGSALRVSVQLVDAATGTHMWAETYDRDLAEAGIFKLQDDITDRVVATVADPYGILVRSMALAVRDRQIEELSARELTLRCVAYWHHIRPDEHARLRTALERTLEREPAHAEARACLSRLYSQEHEFRLNPLPGSVERAREAARRAVDADPTCQAGWEALAEASYFARDLGAFRNAAERAMALNPRNTSTLAFMGVLISHGGDWDRGVGIVQRSMELNPHHPGWYHFPRFFDQYRKREFEQALETTKRMNMPEDFWTHATTAAACGRLGRSEEARAALDALRSLLPGYREELGPTLGLWILDALVVEQVMEGVAQAEALVGEPPRIAPAPASTSRDATQKAPVAIAVLPFADMSASKDQVYLCEGMAEEVMNALGAIGSIRVASRTSAFRASAEGKDVAEIARVLSVSHLLEGSVRTAGSRLRVTAQLTDVASGFQLWSERFDREAGDVFAVQDEIAAGVVEAVRARFAPGRHAIVPRPQPRNLEAYQHYLRGRHLRYTKNDVGSAARSFEQAIGIDPEHAPSWVGLAEVKVLGAFYLLLPAREAHRQAKYALATAARLQGETATALYVEGMIAFAERDWPAAERLLRRALEIEPHHVPALCRLALLFSVLGRPDDATAPLQLARDLDPLSPWPLAMTGLCLLSSRRPREAERYLAQASDFDKENTLALWASGLALVMRGRAAEGIEALTRASTPSHRGGFIHALLGWAFAVAGREDQARAVLAELRMGGARPSENVAEAWLRAVLGDADGAWAILERVEQTCQQTLLLAGMPGFDPLRADPRFAAMLERLGLPAAFAAIPADFGGVSHRVNDRSYPEHPPEEPNMPTIPTRIY